MTSTEQWFAIFCLLGNWKFLSKVFKERNAKAETETQRTMIFFEIYSFSAGQTSLLLQVQWEFYIGTCFYRILSL